MPSARLFYNSIFLKLWNYNAHGATRYLEANYAEYPDKERFLRFLNEQLKFRIGKFKKGSKSNFALICAISLEWVQENLAKWKNEQKIVVYNQYIRQDLNLIVKNELQNKAHSNSPESIEKMTEEICSNLEDKMNSVLEKAESRFIGLADKYETGDIQLVNQNMKTKLTNLFLCLKSLTAKPNRKIRQAIRNVFFQLITRIFEYDK